MKIKFAPRTIALLPLSLLLACGSDDPAAGTGGTVLSGGVITTGGVAQATGGTVLQTGGLAIETGGEAAVTGGTTGATGGEVEATGGTAGVTGGTAGATGGEVAVTGGEVSATGGTVIADGECEAGEAKFSFFVTSLETMREQSGSQDGFGGDFGGLAGADQICQTAATAVGCGAKTWRAFLSATDDGEGNQVNAIDRIGAGPWYDARGLLIAENAAGLVGRGDSQGQGRPDGDANAVDDLANEYGEGLRTAFPDDDDHDIITGSNEDGELDSPGSLAATCNDWTSTAASPKSAGGSGLALGHAWSARSGYNWIQVHRAGTCAAGVNLSFETRGGDGSSVGAGGGWGGIYCFAL